MKNLLFIMFSLLILESCGQSQSPKTLRITSSLIYSSNYTGGLVVSGIGPNNTKFNITTSGAGTLTVPLINGIWTIYAAGWTGATPFTGSSQCGVKAVNLGASDKTIDIDINSANCNHADFRGSFSEIADANGFQEMKIFNCMSLQYAANGTAFDSTTSMSTISSNFCATTLPLDFQERAKSYRVIIPNDSDPSLSLVTQCLTASGPMIDSHLRLPTNKIPVQVELFKDSNCRKDRAVIYEFEDGIISDSDPDGSFFNSLSGDLSNGLLLAFNTPQFGMTPFFNFLPSLTNAAGSFYSPLPNTIAGVDYVIDAGIDHFSRLIISRDPNINCSSITSASNVTTSNCSSQDGKTTIDMKETAAGNCASGLCTINIANVVKYIQSTPTRAREVLNKTYQHMGANLSGKSAILSFVDSFSNNNNDRTFSYGGLDKVREMLGPDSPVGYFGTESCTSLNETKVLSVLDEGQLKVFEVIVRVSSEPIPVSFCDASNPYATSCPAATMFDKQIIFRELLGTYQTRFNMHVICDHKLGMIESIDTNNDREFRDEKSLIYWNTEDSTKARYEVYKSETQFSDVNRTQVIRKNNSFNHVEMLAASRFFISTHEYQRELGNIETSEDVSKTEIILNPANNDLLSSSINARLSVGNTNVGPGMNIFDKPTSDRDFKITRLDQDVSVGLGLFLPKDMNFDYAKHLTFEAIVYRSSSSLKLKFFDGLIWSEVSITGSTSNSIYPKVSISDLGKVSVAWIDSTSVYFNKYVAGTGWYGTATQIGTTVNPTSLAVISTSENYSVIFYVDEGASNRVLNKIRLNAGAAETISPLESLTSTDLQVVDSIKPIKVATDAYLITWVSKLGSSFYIHYKTYQPSLDTNSPTLTVVSPLPSPNPLDFKLSSYGGNFIYSYSFGGPSNNRHHVKFDTVTGTYGPDQNMSYSNYNSINDCISSTSFSPGSCTGITFPTQTYKPVKPIAPNIESLNPTTFNNIFTPLNVFINIQ